MLSTLVMPVTVMAKEEVLYCVPEVSGGIAVDDKTGEWRGISKFKNRKFIVKLNEGGSSALSGRDELFDGPMDCDFSDLNRECILKTRHGKRAGNFI